MEVKTEHIIDSGTEHLTFSIRRQEYMEREGERLNVGPPVRRAVVPGDFKTVELFAPELLPMFKKLWTKDAIATFEKRTAAEQERAALSLRDANA